MSDNPFYNNIKYLAKLNCMSINQLEAQLGLPRNAINNYKNGTSNPSVYRAIKIANYFGISIDELLNEGNQKFRMNVEYIFNHLTDEQKKEMSKFCFKWLTNQKQANNTY